jgi:hypothetical protein
MGKLFVTVFALAPALRQICNGLKPGLSPLQVMKILQQDYFLASGQFIVANAAPLDAAQICKTGLLPFSAPACTETLD